MSASPNVVPVQLGVPVTLAIDMAGTTVSWTITVSLSPDGKTVTFSASSPVVANSGGGPVVNSGGQPVEP